MLSALASLPAPDSPAAIGWFALTGAAVVVLINQVMTFYKEHIREQPTPSDTYATKTDHRDLALKMDTELGRERGSRKKMHEEIASLQGDVKELRAESEGQIQQLSELKVQINETNTRIDEIPKRTIELLATTKALHR